MVEALLRRSDPRERAELALRWAALRQDEAGATAAIEQVTQLCAAAGRPRRARRGECADLLLAMDATLRAGLPRLTERFRSELGVTVADLCEGRRPADLGAFDRGMCAGRRLSPGAIRADAAAQRAARRHEYDPYALWQLAAADAAASARTTTVRLADPEGPYNPFVVLAARDSGDSGRVRVDFTETDAATGPESLASYSITRWLVDGARTCLPPRSQVALRAALAEEDDPRLQLLFANGLLAAGVPARVANLPTGGCAGLPWLVSGADVCDLRGSLLLSLYRELRRGASR